MIFHTAELLGEIERLLDSENGSRERIFLVGAQDHARMESWYNSADFIISGSRYEGSGTAVCEAMSCGCIPILTDIAAFRMMTGRGHCGLLYPAGDRDALSSALLTASAMHIAEEREKVLRQFRSRLSFEAIAAGMEEIGLSIKKSLDREG